jgi:hypothetical protein
MDTPVQLLTDDTRGKNIPELRQWLESVHEQRFLTKLERRVDKRREEYARLRAFDRRTLSIEPVDELDLYLHMFKGVHASAVLENALNKLRTTAAENTAELPTLTQQLSQLIEHHPHNIQALCDANGVHTLLHLFLKTSRAETPTYLPHLLHLHVVLSLSPVYHEALLRESPTDLHSLFDLCGVLLQSTNNVALLASTFIANLSTHPDLRIVVGQHLRQHLVKRVSDLLSVPETTLLSETLLRCLSILALNSDMRQWFLCNEMLQVIADALTVDWPRPTAAQIPLLQCVTNFVFATRYTQSHTIWRNGTETLQRAVAAVATQYVGCLANTATDSTTTLQLLRTLGALLLYASPFLGEKRPPSLSIFLFLCLCL